MKSVITYLVENTGVGRAYRWKKYFRAVRAAEAIVWPKGFIDDSCRFANGDGYIQLTTEQVKNFMNAYRNIIENFEPNLLIMFDKNPKGFIGRYLDDGGSLAYSLWGLANQIDIYNRLWGQPYYGLNPQAGKQKVFELK